MGFFSNLVSAPFHSIGTALKGVGQTLASPFKAGIDALKTVGSAAKDFLTLHWFSIPKDVVGGAVSCTKDLAEGPLNVCRGTVGLAALPAGALAGSALGGPLGGVAGYSAAAQFSNWVA